MKGQSFQSLGSILGLVVLLFFHNIVEAVVEKEIFKLTSAQKYALDSLKERVIPLLDKEYKKQDVYLIRWLRARNFNVENAQALLQKDMEWRRSERMDTILEENWKYLSYQLPYDMEGVDKDGQPMILCDLSEWDLRRAILSTGQRRVDRYLQKMLEEADVKIRRLQEEGNKNITRFQLIVSIEDFNSIQHGCLHCRTIFSKLAATLGNHFPYIVNNVIVINAPQIFPPIVTLARPLLGDEFKRILHVYGTKDEWGPILLGIAHPSHLPPAFGGTKN